MSTDWESCYRTGETPWDKGAAAPPLIDWLATPAGQSLQGDVLVPGCGLGHDVRALARHAQTRPYGLDLSPAALSAARGFAPAGSETYLVGNLFALDPAWRGRFDWVVEHTCFCAIDPVRRPDYVRAVAEALRPGGHLFAIFYLQPWKNGEVPPPGGGPPFGTDARELDALFHGHFEQLDEFVPARAYRGREGRELVRLLRKTK